MSKSTSFSGFDLEQNRTMPKFNSKAGFTITEGLVGMALIVLAALLVASLIAFFKANAVRIDHRAAIQSILVESIADLKTLSYDELKEFCEFREAMDADVTAKSKCFPSSSQAFLELNSNLAEVGPPGTTAEVKPIEQLLNILTGQFDANGIACVALVGCEEPVPNQLIVVKLNGLWRDPNGSKAPPINSTVQSFNRSRW